MTVPTVEKVTDTSTDSLPDFEPQCSIHYTNPAMQFAGIPPQRCEHPAKWSGMTPCCGVVALVCEHHRFCHLNLCCPCSRLCDDLIGWARL